MTCDACGEDKIVTVTYGIKLERVNPRDGRSKVEQRERRLCASCGGGLQPEETRA